MTAEAIARLRDVAAYAQSDPYCTPRTADLRAVLDAHDKKDRDHLNAVLEIERLRQAHTALEAKLEEERERYESTFITPADDAVAKVDALLTEALDAVQCAVEEFGWDDPAEEAHECIRPMLAVLAKAGRR